MVKLGCRIALNLSIIICLKLLQAYTAQICQWRCFIRFLVNWYRCGARGR